MVQENPDSKPECYIDKYGPEAYEEWEKQQMDEHGWFVHFILGDAETATGSCAHTHGLPKTFEHPDLQITCPLPEKTAHNILIQAVELIRHGVKFINGEDYDSVIGGDLKVRAFQATEGGRSVIRLIMPDKHGNLDKEKMEGPFASQYE